MSQKTKWIFAVLALGMVIACMKAGDGVGLAKDGGMCTADSKDSNCIAYLHPCIANPSGPGCPVDCSKNPSAAGCPVDSCKANPSLCTVHCATTPTAQICVDSCAINSNLSWCSPKVDCNATPTLKVCVDSCTANPSLSWCGPAKTKFAEAYAVISGSVCLTACHIPGGAGVITGKLNMENIDSAYANLVGALVTDQKLAPRWVRVKPGSPDSSMLVIKVEAGMKDITPKLPDGTAYYQAMPLQGMALTKAKIDIIRKWITDGALR